MQFNETDLGIISNALRVAAEKFRENVTVAEDAPPGFTRVAQQFDRQATEAMRVYDAISARTGIAS